MHSGNKKFILLQGARIHISGIVQGVGFRPFVYGLAEKYGLNGWVRNSSAGVDIEVDGSQVDLKKFIHDLSSEAPALAKIDSLESVWIVANGFKEFKIFDSISEPSQFQPVSPDVCVCADCFSELFDPTNRRYRYPFINCTNCGPRFTIIQDIPYDRPRTTMAEFKLCPECSHEYDDPRDRRFHAQPVACSNCGPRVWLEGGTQGDVISHEDEAARMARLWLLDGKILAIKGLGGFHLACDATNPAAVEELRRRKLRVDKAFALMAADVQTASAHCWINPSEEEQLERRERPIVILRRHPDSTIAAQVSPNQTTIGIMLPYTPLHYLLFAKPDSNPVIFDMPPLVMTSANLSDEPICTENEEARLRLASLADGFLMHNRLIQMRCDDSVLRVFSSSQGEQAGGLVGERYLVRRARGYAPAPINLHFDAPPLLAVGAELKNTFCLTRDRYAFISHHIGDLENFETLLAFENAVKHYERLFRVKPETIVCDLHPDYLSTRYAEQRACQDETPIIGVQHHHAHIAACMTENSLSGDEPVIGVSFDGTGFGDDGAIWGGEFLLADYHGYRRLAHLAYVPLPGGDLAVREPWRMALAWLWHAGVDWGTDLAPVKYAMSETKPNLPILNALQHQLVTGLNAAPTSSIGRLFDAVAALCGVRQILNYEAQAAVELEALACGDDTVYYSFEVDNQIIDAAPVIQDIVKEVRRGTLKEVISKRFHNSLARMVQIGCRNMRQDYGVNKIALSGGVWQNTLLLSLTIKLLEADHFDIYLHRHVPTNDGGLSLGQAAVAIAQLREKS